MDKGWVGGWQGYIFTIVGRGSTGVFFIPKELIRAKNYSSSSLDSITD